MRKRKDLRPTVTLAGAHRGAEYLLDPLSEWDKETTQGALVRVIDPRQDRLHQLESAASVRGLATEGNPLRLEEVLVEGPFEERVLILTLDSPASIASAIRLTKESRCAIFGYLLLRLPNNVLWGVRMLLLPDDAAGRRAAEQLFETLAKVTVRTGSGAIFGEQGAPEHLVAEGLLRSWMGAHLKENLSKVLSGLPVVSYPIEVTDDGVVSSPLVVAEEGRGGATPALDNLLENLAAPLAAGSTLIIAHLSERAIRFTRVRIGRKDGLSSRPFEVSAGELEVPVAKEREVAVAALTAPVAMTD